MKFNLTKKTDVVAHPTTRACGLGAMWRYTDKFTEILITLPFYIILIKINE